MTKVLSVVIIMQSKSSKALDMCAEKLQLSIPAPCSPKNQQVLAKARKKTFCFSRLIARKVFKTSVNRSVLQASWDTGASLFFCYFPSIFLS